MIKQICINCVMDTTNTELRFDDKGMCNRCNDFTRIYCLFGIMARVVNISESNSSKIKETGKTNNTTVLLV